MFFCQVFLSKWIIFYPWWQALSWYWCHNRATSPNLLLCDVKRDGTRTRTRMRNADFVLRLTQEGVPLQQFHNYFLWHHLLNHFSSLRLWLNQIYKAFFYGISAKFASLWGKRVRPRRACVYVFTLIRDYLRSPQSLLDALLGIPSAWNSDKGVLPSRV